MMETINVREKLSTHFHEIKSGHNHISLALSKSPVKPCKKTAKKGALWVKLYPAQAKKLRPENNPYRMGIKSRSTSQEIRMAVYRAIRLLYLDKHPECQCCFLIRDDPKSLFEPRPATTIHHVKGKESWLLVDVRWFKSACLPCHSWIDSHREEARKLGLLAKTGDWNKIT